MNLLIGIPALGQNDTLQKNIDLIRKNLSEKIDIVVWDNGSEIPIPKSDKYLLCRSEKNLGVPQAMNKIMKYHKADYYMFIHSDVEIYEKDFDKKIIKMIKEIGEDRAGVLGGFGSLQLGALDINKTPYNKFQLGRAHNLQGNKNRLEEVHGGYKFENEYRECVTLDGYMLIVKKGLKFWNNAPHHMYDHDICMESLKNGYKNYTINIDHYHQGGVSVTRENWTRDLNNTEDEIHDLAHTEFYNKWKDYLPKIL